MFILYLVKLATILRHTVQRQIWSLRIKIQLPRNVTLTVTRKDCSYYQRKYSKCRPTVLTQTRSVHAAGRLPRRWHAIADRTRQQLLCAVDTLVHDALGSSPRNSGRDYSVATGPVSRGPEVPRCMPNKSLHNKDVGTPCADMYAAVRLVAEGRTRPLHCA